MTRKHIALLAGILGCSSPSTTQTADSDTSGTAGTTPPGTQTNTGSGYTPLQDSDGDGYLDSDEVFEGTDPMDYDSRIYQGFWPYWRNKNSLGSPAVERIGTGDQMPRLIAPDQHGDFVDLYDFGGPQSTQRYVVLVVCGDWTPPCHDLANWLAGASVNYLDPYTDMRDDINAGVLGMVYAISEDIDGLPPAPSLAGTFYAAYPTDSVAFVADTEQLGADTLVATTNTWPTAALLDPASMEVLYVGGPTEVLRESRY